MLTLSLLSYFSILATYFFTYLRAKGALQSETQGKKPPIAPYWIPLLGHLVSFPVDFDALLTSVVFGTSWAIRLSLLTEEVILVTGAENIRLVWRNSQWLTAKAGHIIGLFTIVDTPKKSLEFYKADSSGIGKTPLPHSNVPPEHRVWHLTHQPITDCLSGSNLEAFTESFQTALRRRIEQCPIGYEWVELSDLYDFIYTEVIHVQLELLCGTFFLEQNPNFAQDFREFNHTMIHLKKGLPKWMTPQSCKARNECLASVYKWHKALTIHDPNRFVDTGELQNARFGNEIMRSRRRIMAKIDAMDEATAASADLGMLWALNANPVTATFWVLLEILRDPFLQPYIHDEITKATTREPTNSTLPYLSPYLPTTSPLLQSIYAETLRLRVSVMIVQSAEFGPFRFKEWIFPKDELILISSRIAHMDPQSWNTGSNGEFPVTRFWAERFLVWEDENNKELKKGKVTVPGRNSDKTQKSQSARSNPSELTPETHSLPNLNCYTSSKCRFTTTGFTGTFIPYGGGPGICPGRHFAKSNMLLASMLLFSAFETSLDVPKDWEPEVDLRYYGLGVLPPKGKVPCRIRRRRQERAQAGGTESKLLGPST
ncbi:MAG: hypothetical protein Q9166_007497 [cf. Caloplaca sp. 2 TL-2023]